MSVVTWIVQRLLELGIRVTILGPMMLLTVRGRRSGQPRTLPIDVHDVDGRRYLIASHGIGSWVQNLRAAGAGTLRLGRQRIDFTARELPADEAGRINRTAFPRLIATDDWRGRGIRANLGVSKTSPAADYVVSARDHPVFEVCSLTAATRDVSSKNFAKSTVWVIILLANGGRARNIRSGFAFTVRTC